MTDTKESNIIITLEIQPVVKGKRKIIASASRPGEMPLIEVGHFSELNDLITRTWLGVQKRKPAPVKAAADRYKSEKQKRSKPAAAPADTANQADAEPPADQLVASPQPEPVIEASPETLPVIEGDVAAPEPVDGDFVQAALMEEQNA